MTSGQCRSVLIIGLVLAGAFLRDPLAWIVVAVGIYVVLRSGR